MTAQRAGRAQLLTVPYSHFCEMAKWSLARAGVPFDEVTSPPVAHIFPTLATRFPAGGGRRVAVDSSSIVSSNTSIPLLALPSGEVLLDSWAILDFASKARPELGGVPDSLRAILDKELGPLARQSAYAVLLKDANYDTWSGLVTHNTGPLWRLAWFMTGARVTKMMVKTFHSQDAARMSECEAKLRECVDKVGAEVKALTPAGALFIRGASPGLSDIAVASLMAVKCLPEAYCGGVFSPYFSRIMETDEGAKKDAEMYRTTPLGRHCMSAYQVRG